MLTYAEAHHCTNCYASIHLNNNQCSNEAVKSLIKYTAYEMMVGSGVFLSPPHTLISQSLPPRLSLVSHSHRLDIRSLVSSFFSLSLSALPAFFASPLLPSDFQHVKYHRSTLNSLYFTEISRSNFQKKAQTGDTSSSGTPERWIAFSGHINM